MATYHGETMVWRYDEQVCQKCEGRRQGDGPHTKTQTYTKPQDARRRRQDKGKTWYATPPPPHPQTSTRFLYRERQQEAAQGMTSMLQKKKHESAFHALSIGETQRGEVCYRRRNEKEKKKGGNTKHNTQKKKKKRTCARPFSTGEENMVEQKERYVLRIKHATHFCYASTGPLLLCFLNHADDRRREPAKV